MKMSQIHTMTVEEVQRQLDDAREELWRLRFRAATENLENPLLIRTRRRDIARLLTVLKEHRSGIRTLAHAEAPKSEEGTES
jgi:large subunit ribosomal protein L29